MNSQRTLSNAERIRTLNNPPVNEADAALARTEVAKVIDALVAQVPTIADTLGKNADGITPSKYGENPDAIHTKVNLGLQRDALKHWATVLKDNKQALDMPETSEKMQGLSQLSHALGGIYKNLPDNSSIPVEQNASAQNLTLERIEQARNLHLAQLEALNNRHLREAVQSR